VISPDNAQQVQFNGQGIQLLKLMLRTKEIFYQSIFKQALSSGGKIMIFMTHVALHSFLSNQIQE